MTCARPRAPRAPLCVLAGFALTAALMSAGAVRADVVYSNMATSQHHVVASITWWDDAQIVGGGRLERFRMFGENAQSGTPRTYSATVRIRQFDTAAGLPNGPVLGQFNMTSATPMSGGETRLLESSDLTPLNINLPNDARLGIEYVFGSNFGVLMYDPPTIGTSQSPLWRDNPPVPHPIGNLVGNTAFELITVPEPSCCAAVLTTLVVTGRCAGRRRSLKCLRA